jgi:hypothetical protein
MALVASRAFALIVTDIIMPAPDGLAVLGSAGGAGL